MAFVDILAAYTAVADSIAVEEAVDTNCSFAAEQCSVDSLDAVERMELAHHFAVELTEFVD